MGVLPSQGKPSSFLLFLFSLATTSLLFSPAPLVDGIIQGGKHVIRPDHDQEEGFLLYGYSNYGVCELTVTDTRPAEERRLSPVIFPVGLGDGTPTPSSTSSSSSSPVPSSSSSSSGVFTEGLVFALTAINGTSLPEPTCQDLFSHEEEYKASGFVRFHLVPQPSPSSSVSSSGDGKEQVEEEEKTSKDPPARWVGKIKFIEENLPAGFWDIHLARCGAATIPPLSVEVVQYQQYSAYEWTYLQVGDAPLPFIFALGALVLFGCVLKWIHMMYEHHTFLHRIHYAMLLALVMKFFVLLFEFFRYSHYRDSGNMNSFYDIMFYTFIIMKGMTVAAVVTLIGSGWSVMKPFLNPCEVYIIIIVVALQLVTNISWAALDHLPHYMQPPHMGMVLLCTELICSVLICIPSYRNIRQLQIAQNVEGKVIQSVVRGKRFRFLGFIIAASCYIRLSVFLMREPKQRMIEFNHTYFVDMWSEYVTIAFFVSIGWMFRPGPTNYLQELDEDDYAVAGVEIARELADIAKSKSDLEKEREEGPNAGVVTTSHGDEEDGIGSQRSKGGHGQQPAGGPLRLKKVQTD